MAWRLQRPLITVSCHDDRTANPTTTTPAVANTASRIRARRCSKRGAKSIHAFCITIDEQARDYLPHMYGAANYTMIDDVAKLPLKVSDIYRRITT